MATIETNMSEAQQLRAQVTILTQTVEKMESDLESTQIQAQMAANRKFFWPEMGGGDTESDLSFHQVLSLGNQLVVHSGSIIMGITRFDVGTTTLTLTGSEVWVYAYVRFDGSEAGVNVLSTDPLSMPFDSMELRWRLAKFTASSPGIYTRSQHYWYGGDLTAYAPLA